MVLFDTQPAIIKLNFFYLLFDNMADSLIIKYHRYKRVVIAVLCFCLLLVESAYIVLSIDKKIHCGYEFWGCFVSICLINWVFVTAYTAAPETRDLIPYAIISVCRVGFQAWACVAVYGTDADCIDRLRDKTPQIYNLLFAETIIFFIELFSELVIHITYFIIANNICSKWQHQAAHANQPGEPNANQAAHANQSGEPNAIHANHEGCVNQPGEPNTNQPGELDHVIQINQLNPHNAPKPPNYPRPPNAPKPPNYPRPPPSAPYQPGLLENNPPDLISRTEFNRVFDLYIKTLEELERTKQQLEQTQKTLELFMR